MQLLTFTLNDIRFDVPVEDVESIENRMDVVGVPNAPAHFEGIIDVNEQQLIPMPSIVNEAQQEVARVLPQILVARVVILPWM